MSSKLLERYDRNRMGGFIMEHIASSRGISLGEAVGVYVSHPEIEERLNNDDYDDVMNTAYPERILDELGI